MHVVYIHMLAYIVCMYVCMYVCIRHVCIVTCDFINQSLDVLLRSLLYKQKVCPPQRAMLPPQQQSRKGDREKQNEPLLCEAQQPRHSQAAWTSAHTCCSVRTHMS